MKTKDFLLEIGVEELPPKQIPALISSLATNLEESLKERGLSYGAVKPFSSPRRLAVLISAVSEKQPDQPLELRGPPVEIAFDKEGLPTIAARKFATTCGVEIAELKRILDKKGEILFHQTIKSGKYTFELLPEIVVQAIKKMVIKKPMYWNDHAGPFVRPVHWVVALFDQEVIPLEIFGIKATNKTFGHRFHSPKPLVITSPNKYEALLENNGSVIADASKRKEKILEKTSLLTQDDVALISEDLLSEITNLVEWPVALMGTFNERFLKVPKEVLVTTLETQQRCIPIADEAGELLPRFVIISNIESKDPNQVIVGNERVVRARFTDAEYFYHQDLKNSLIANLEKLKHVSFQEKLGSLYDKTMRLKTLSSFIAPRIKADVSDTSRAAELAKCDLPTQMVWEFPELQGIMGYYYAKKHENETIAIAIKEQYLPRFSKDQIPATLVGSALALADRIDSLVGFFGIDKIPSGDKDPFGLRRAATSILRIILEKNLVLDLKETLEKSCTTYKDLIKNKGELVARILDFIYERLRFSYIEQNKNVNVFRSVLACTPTDLQDFAKRYDAVDKFTLHSESTDLIEIFKRISNILDKAKTLEKLKFNPSLATEAAEKNLATIVEQKKEIILDFHRRAEYRHLLSELISLKVPLGHFFDKVMVMTDNEKIRNNRLALLQAIQNLFMLIADLSHLVSG